MAEFKKLCHIIFVSNQMLFFFDFLYKQCKDYRPRPRIRHHLYVHIKHRFYLSNAYCNTMLIRVYPLTHHFHHNRNTHPVKYNNHLRDTLFRFGHNMNWYSNRLLFRQGDIHFPLYRILELFHNPCEHYPLNNNMMESVQFHPLLFQFNQH